jgi:Mg-chelatase subunit ChlD
MKHLAEQFELPAVTDGRPREIVTRDSREYFETLAKLREQGAVIEAISTVPQHNAAWRITVRWPANRETTCTR